MRHIFAILILSLLSACGAPEEGAVAAGPQDTFFSRLGAHCGASFEGRLVSTDASDAAIGAQRLVMQVRECNDREIRIPFHVGDDHSRTWVITRQHAGLRLKHDHRHEDGREDGVTEYGGDTEDEGTNARQSFPVDAFSIAMFEREGLTASVTNVWSVEINEAIFAYELARSGRFFRVEFDLAKPVDAPPAPWGAQ